MLFKSILSAAILLLGFISATNFEVALEEEKHCKPRCCGCDRSKAKFKVRRLTDIFNNLMSDSGTVQLAMELTDHEGSMYVTGENCGISPFGCCYSSGPIEGLPFIYSGAEVLNNINWINEKCDGSVIVNSTSILNYSNPPRSKVYSFEFTWIQKEDCNYKINQVKGGSLACQFLVTQACSGCQTP